MPPQVNSTVMLKNKKGNMKKSTIALLLSIVAISSFVSAIFLRNEIDRDQLHIFIIVSLITSLVSIGLGWISRKESKPKAIISICLSSLLITFLTITAYRDGEAPHGAQPPHTTKHTGPY